jgi:uncharacterized protein (TIGR03437 family)
VQNERVLRFPVDPAFESRAEEFFGWNAIKGDWSGILTEQPGPGEIFHVYGTGFGRVHGPMQTGVPAPNDAAVPIQSPFRCQSFPQPSSLETLFAGYAPGMIGAYQITFRVPEDAGNTPASGIACSFDGLSWSTHRGCCATDQRR